jgi:sialic acid synthase SpsE
MYARRSVTTTQAVRAGETFSAEMLTCKRPGRGIGASSLDSVIGLRAKRDIAADTSVSWGDVE